MPKLSTQTVEFIRKLIVDMMSIVCVGVVLALGVNQFRTENKIQLFDKTVWVEEDSPEDAAVMQELSGLNPITPALAYAKMKAKGVLFVDSRHPVEFDKGHIEGAINLPWEDFGRRFGDFLEQYPPETVIITYCDGKNCDLARQLGEELHYAGYEVVYYMEPGWQSWLNSGKPVIFPILNP